MRSNCRAIADMTATNIIDMNAINKNLFFLPRQILFITEINFFSIYSLWRNRISGEAEGIESYIKRTMAESKDHQSISSPTTEAAAAAASVAGTSQIAKWFDGQVLFITGSTGYVS